MAEAVCTYEPFIQGDLDGLCGIYSCVNAFNNLAGVDLSGDELRGIFKTALLYLNHKTRDGAVKAITEGINGETLQELLPYLAERLSMKTKYTFQVRTLLDNVPSLADVWDSLDACIAAGGVAIVAVAGDKNHWTCVTRVTPKRLWCCDSDGLQWLNRSQCTLGEMRSKRINELNPYDIFGVFLSGCTHDRKKAA